MALYEESYQKIKWRKQDIAELQRVIKNFNQKRTRLIKQEKNLEREERYIEKTIEKESLKDARDLINTRKEFNRYIASLKAFTKRGAEEIDIKHFEETGQRISKWQKNEINRSIKIAKVRLNKELDPYRKVVKDSGGLTKIDMRNTEARAIENRIKGLENYKNKQIGFDFKESIRNLRRQGSYSYTVKKAEIYKENYIETMEKYKDFPKYNEFIKKLKSFKNPVEFYNYIKEKDFSSDLTYQSDEYLSINRYIDLLQEWGVDISEEDYADLEEKV